MHLSAWKQSMDWSCGPACLLVALNEFIHLEISEPNEHRIWLDVRFRIYWGSLAPSLADHVRRQYGLGSMIYVHEAEKELFLRTSPPDRQERYDWYLAENLRENEALRAQGLPVITLPPHQPAFLAMVEALLANHDIKVIPMIRDDDGILHYVLLRANEQQRIVVMDPDSGLNREWGVREFLADYQGRVTGLYVVLARTLGELPQIGQH